LLFEDAASEADDRARREARDSIVMGNEGWLNRTGRKAKEVLSVDE
jgi:hypothetical protein